LELIAREIKPLKVLKITDFSRERLELIAPEVKLLKVLKESDF
jgi:hypothetical protein